MKAWLGRTNFASGLNNALQQCLFIVGVGNVLGLQSFTGHSGHLGVALVFVWSSALRERVNFCFSRVFASIDKTFIFAGGLQLAYTMFISNNRESFHL